MTPKNLITLRVGKKYILDIVFLYVCFNLFKPNLVYHAKSRKHFYGHSFLDIIFGLSLKTSGTDGCRF